MQSVKDKLRALNRQAGAGTPNRENKFDQTNVAALGVSVVQNEYGSCLLREKRFPLDFQHGGHILAEYLNLRNQDFAYVNKKECAAEIHPRDFIFFDTETTGLAGGSGTYIFLCGLGYFEQDCFVLKQFLLYDFQNESAFLFEILNLFVKFAGIISFNGKSYDLYLLKTRLILNKMKAALDAFEHIDLLHASRRFWKKSIGECNLANIEKRILGFARQNDVPGSNIPQMYFDFVRSGDFERLTPVFKHNAIDILSMVSLVVVCATLFQAQKHTDRGADEHAIFRTFAKLKQYGNIMTMMQESIDSKDAALLLEFSYLLKRLGKLQEAVAIWRHLASRSVFIEDAYWELAKYYEHKAVNYSNALEIIERTLKRAEIRSALATSAVPALNRDWRHRKNRIMRKLSQEKQTRIETTN